MNNEPETNPSGHSNQDSDWMSKIPKPTIPSPTPVTPIIPTPPVSTPKPVADTDERLPERVRLAEELSDDEAGELYAQAKTVFYTGYATGIPFIGLLIAFLCWKRTKPWKDEINEHEYSLTSTMVRASIRSSQAWFLFSCIILFLGLTSFSFLSMASVQMATAAIALAMTYIILFLSRVIMEEDIGFYDSAVIAIRMVTGGMVLIFLSMTIFRENSFYHAFSGILYWIVGFASVASVLDFGKAGRSLGWRIYVLIVCSISLLSFVMKGVAKLVSIL